MAIRIERNEAGNCVNFHGSKNPTYWNACLSGEVDAQENWTVNVINDVVTAETGVIEYEFYRIPYTELRDKDGNSFNDATAAADYITASANVLTTTGIDLTGIDVCFDLDDTSTTILMSIGDAPAVNSIKAVLQSNGNISLVSTKGDVTKYINLEPSRACIAESPIAGGVNDIINTLNELFTVGAFTSVVISDPYSTLIADVGGVITSYEMLGSTVIDPIGTSIASNSATGNYAGIKTTEKIDQPGEYFTFYIRKEGQIGFGFIISDDNWTNNLYRGNSLYAEPDKFAVGNSAHYGFQWSHWFHPTPNGSWTNYGADASYASGPGWSANWDSKDDWLADNPVLMRAGIDDDGRLAVWSRNATDDGWILHARSGYVVQQGAEFHLGIKMADANARVYSIPKVHLLEPAAPVMNFRYVESPDGYYSYPLFATQEEANYYYVESGGTITDPTQQSHTHLYEDDPSFTNWYMPHGFNQMNYELTPQEDGITTFKGNTINWTEITTLTNAEMRPSAFSQTDITVDELSAVNIQVHPPDAGFTTSVLNDGGSGLHIDNLGLHLTGTAPEVTDNNVNNPSDTYTITIRRSNSYGDTDGTFNLIVNNLTAPEETIDGFHQHTGSILGGLMQDGSVYQLQHQGQDLIDAHRLVIPKQWVADNVLPYLLGAGDTYVAGFLNSTHDTSTLETSDFDFAITWEYVDANSHKFSFVRDGSVMTGGGSADVSTKSVTVNSTTNAVYDFAIELDGTSAWLIACNVNNIMNEASPNDGGIFSHYAEVTNYDAGHTGVHFGVISMEGGLEEGTATLSVIDTPAPAPSHLTSWSKAIDFSGSEYAKHVNNSMFYQPLQMAGLANTVPGHSTQGYTANNSSSRPWATVVVFKSDGYSGNQMIWNQGEGSTSGDDNMFVNVTANGTVNFGWGRSGTGYNQCEILTNISSSTWYAVYVAHSGERLGGNNATASALADCFDIRTMSSADSFATLSSNLSVTANWVVTGVRMDRTFAGDFTVGGRGTGYSFRGKVASMITHCLKAGVLMPNATEIKLMITDPLKWEADYLIGNSYRRPFYVNSSTNYQKDTSLGFKANQMWLMGDGTPDTFPNINNEQRPNFVSYTNLVMTGMVSNDIENVSIPGLS